MRNLKEYIAEGTCKPRVTDEFGNDITSIVDVMKHDGEYKVTDEFGQDITSIVKVHESYKDI